MANKQQTLQEVFGFDSFRPLQEQSSIVCIEDNIAAFTPLFSKPNIWSCINANKGDITTKTPSINNAGNWLWKKFEPLKQRLKIKTLKFYLSHQNAYKMPIFYHF
jgi:hypothetical protein